MKPTYDDLMTARGDRIEPDGLFDILRDLKAELAEIEENEGVEDLDVRDRIESVEALIEGLNGSTLGAAYIVTNRRTLIAADYFEEYAQDEAEDTTGIEPKHPIWGHVNWKDYADELRADYAEVVIDHGEFAGTWYAQS